MGALCPDLLPRPDPSAAVRGAQCVRPGGGRGGVPGAGAVRPLPDQLRELDSRRFEDLRRARDLERSGPSPEALHRYARRAAAGLADGLSRRARRACPARGGGGAPRRRRGGRPCQLRGPEPVRRAAAAHGRGRPQDRPVRRVEPDPDPGCGAPLLRRGRSDRAAPDRLGAGRGAPVPRRRRAQGPAGQHRSEDRDAGAARAGLVREVVLLRLGQRRLPDLSVVRHA